MIQPKSGRVSDDITRTLTQLTSRQESLSMGFFILHDSDVSEKHIYVSQDISWPQPQRDGPWPGRGLNLWGKALSLQEGT